VAAEKEFLIEFALPKTRRAMRLLQGGFGRLIMEASCWPLLNSSQMIVDGW